MGWQTGGEPVSSPHNSQPSPSTQNHPPFQTTSRPSLPIPYLADFCTYGPYIFPRPVVRLASPTVRRVSRSAYLLTWPCPSSPSGGPSNLEIKDQQPRL